MKMRRGNRGGAVILAILAVALVTASATYLLRSQSLWIGQVQTAVQLAQGRELLLAGLDWACSILADDARNSNNDHLGEVWAKTLPPSQSEGWDISGRIEDAQARFNLNNLVRNGNVSQADMEIFARLLQMVGAPKELAQSLADWIDEDSDVASGGGAEDSAYLQAKPPYRAANRPLTELANLSRVRGFDPEIIKRLLPYVTVLPQPTPVNANTASPQVLAAVIPGLSLSEARVLAQNRDQTPLNNLNELQSRLPRNLPFRSADLSVGSTFFLVTGNAKMDDKQIGLVALVHREGMARPRLIWRREP